VDEGGAARGGAEGGERRHWAGARCGLRGIGPDVCIGVLLAAGEVEWGGCTLKRCGGSADASEVESLGGLDCNGVSADDLGCGD